MQNVFNYLDYRKFLNDFYEHQKSENPFYSFRYIGLKVKMDHSLIVKILLGKRHISKKKIKDFARFCKFNSRESEYFEKLVFFNKAKTDKDIKKYFEQLLSLKRNSSKNVEFEQYQFYQKWYYSTVRSALEYLYFKDDYIGLAKHLSPSISTNQAKEAIELLENLKFIQRDDKGFFRLTDHHVTSVQSWKPLAIKTFQKESIKLSEQSIERHLKEFRDISTITMAIKPDHLEEIKERIKICRESIIGLVDEIEDPNCVYQLNLQLIPLTQVNEREAN